MFCRKCGKELDEGWKICPNCGQRVNEDSDNSKMYENTVKSEASQKQPVVQQSVNRAFLGWIPMVVCFVMGIIIIAAGWIASAGVFLIIAGILMCPRLLNMVSKKIRISMLAAAAVLVIIVCADAVTWFSMDRGGATIDYVKQYQAPDAYLSIGEIIEMDAEDGTEWTYYETEDTEYVAVQYTRVTSGNSMEIIFSVNDYPALYELKVNGVPDAEMFAGYNNALFGVVPAF